MSVRCAFVGCGGVAENYWNIYRDLDWVHVTVLVDIDRASLERAHAYFSATRPRPRISTNFRDALASDVDLVLVNTPNYLHREQAVAAMAAGKHVLLQKPIAHTLADAYAILDAERRATTKCGVYMSYLDHPLFYDLAGMYRSGWFGSPVQFYARYMHRGGLVWSSESEPGWRTSIEKIGGGVFIQLGVHYIHLFRFISGLEPVSVMGVKDNVYCPNFDGEDIATAVFNYEQGVKATLDTAWTAHGEEISIHGTLGSATYFGNRWLILEGNAAAFEGEVIQAGPDRPALFEIPAVGMGVNQPWNQHRRFLESIRDDTPVPVTLESAIDDLAAVAALYEASATDSRVLLADVTARAIADKVIS
jgi:predicted dehydrogenase